MFAYVCYSRDSVKKIVDVKDIKDFHPKDLGDFNPGRPVRVLWRGLHDDIPTGEALRYAAQVLRLGRKYPTYVPVAGVTSATIFSVCLLSTTVR